MRIVVSAICLLTCMLLPAMAIASTTESATFSGTADSTCSFVSSTASVTFTSLSSGGSSEAQPLSFTIACSNSFQLGASMTSDAGVLADPSTSTPIPLTITNTNIGATGFAGVTGSLATNDWLTSTNGAVPDPGSPFTVELTATPSVSEHTVQGSYSNTITFILVEP